MQIGTATKYCKLCTNKIHIFKNKLILEFLTQFYMQSFEFHRNGYKKISDLQIKLILKW